MKTNTETHKDVISEQSVPHKIISKHKNICKLPLKGIRHNISVGESSSHEYTLNNNYMAILLSKL